jgi:hypothetical protein
MPHSIQRVLAKGFSRTTLGGVFAYPAYAMAIPKSAQVTRLFSRRYDLRINATSQETSGIYTKLRILAKESRESSNRGRPMVDRHRHGWSLLHNPAAMDASQVAQISLRLQYQQLQRSGAPQPAVIDHAEDEHQGEIGSQRPATLYRRSTMPVKGADGPERQLDMRYSKEGLEKPTKFHLTFQNTSI